jgi:hypothetical protein
MAEIVTNKAFEAHHSSTHLQTNAQITYTQIDNAVLGATIHNHPCCCCPPCSCTFYSSFSAVSVAVIAVASYIFIWQDS